MTIFTTVIKQILWSLISLPLFNRWVYFLHFCSRIIAQSQLELKYIQINYFVVIIIIIISAPAPGGFPPVKPVKVSRRDWPRGTERGRNKSQEGIWNRCKEVKSGYLCSQTVPQIPLLERDSQSMRLSYIFTVCPSCFCEAKEKRHNLKLLAKD